MWCEKKNRIIHGTTGKRPIDRLKKENLKPLPAALINTKNSWKKQEKFIKDGFFKFRRRNNGIPWQHSGKEAVVRDKKGKIEILYEGKVIAVQERHYRSKDRFFQRPVLRV